MSPKLGFPLLLGSNPRSCNAMKWGLKFMHSRDKTSSLQAFEDDEALEFLHQKSLWNPMYDPNLHRSQVKLLTKIRVLKLEDRTLAKARQRIIMQT